MSMPWDSPQSQPQPQQPYHPPQQPYQPQPQQPYHPPQQPYHPPQQPYQPSPQQPYQPQQMQPDIPPMPIVARNPATGESVKLDIGQSLQDAIREAVNSAVTKNAGIMQDNANKAVAKLVKAEVQEEVEEQVDDQLEKAFAGGPATTRTFIQGAALDIGAAVFATVATMLSGPDVNVFDKELWGIVAVMMVKTVISTGLSYMMRFKG